MIPDNAWRAWERTISTMGLAVLFAGCVGFLLGYIFGGL
jgi:hypothetical protein